MATDPPPQETLAIAFLVESSLDVAQEWRRRISEYTAALVKRLTDCHPHFKVRVALVSYGPGDHVPSPILSKRYFVDHQVFHKEMAESDMSRFGIGITDSGGRRGMAALDGFVAVLELFDILLNTNPNNAPTPTSYLVHIAATSPDSSTRPLFNDYSALDNVSWDTLPVEIKKRNINLTSINLRNDLTRFSELSAAVVTGGSTPWFHVHNQHTILLAAFPTPPQTKVTPTKRAVEPQVDRVVPEAKRPRLQPITESPKPTPKTATPKAATPQSQPTIAPVPHAQPPSRPVVQAIASQPAAIISMLAKGQISQPQFVAKMKEVEANIKSLQQTMAAAQASGNKELEEASQKEIRARQTTYQNVLHSYQLYKAQLQGNNMSQNPGYSHSLSTGNLPSTSSVSVPSLPQDVAANAPQLQHVRSLSDAHFPMTAASNNPAMMANPNLSSQMQKMIEQQQRGRAPHPNLGQGLGGGMVNNIGPSTSLPNRLNPGPASGSGQPQQQQQQQQQQPNQGTQSTKGTIVWKGALAWSGTTPQGKKDMRAFVAAIHTNDNRCHAETWPAELSLAPVREVSLTGNELTDWIRRHAGQVAICTFIAPNNPGNDAGLASLINLLVEKKIYATASWTTPSGGQSKNALIFPMSGKLVGAFFPLTGLPSNLPTVPDMHARFLQQLQGLPQDTQAALFSKFAQSRAGMPSQQQQPSRSQDHNGTPAFTGSNLLLAHNMMNMMNAQAQNNGGMMNVNGQQQQQQPSFPPSLQRSGMNNNPISNNVSLAMLQSFAQRNDGGTNLNPQG